MEASVTTLLPVLDRSESQLGYVRSCKGGVHESNHKFGIYLSNSTRQVGSTTWKRNLLMLSDMTQKEKMQLETQKGLQDPRILKVKLLLEEQVFRLTY